jgi:hypothetical protein
MTAIRPPKPVPKLATRLNKKILRIAFIVDILISFSAQWLITRIDFHDSLGLGSGSLVGSLGYVGERGMDDTD